jgi:hypothetical protein
MLKLHFNRIQIVFFIVFWYFLFTGLVYASNPFATPRTCSDIFGNCNTDQGTTNDTCTNDCIGEHYPSGDFPRVQEVYINATYSFPGDPINATCQFFQSNDGINYQYILYSSNSGQSWLELWSDNPNNPDPGPANKSVVFNLNSSEGTHIVRCIYSLGKQVTDGCADGEGSSNYDNDDVNLTVTDYLKYNSWNLTNYTSGAEIASSQTYNRNDSYGNITYINVSANWTKSLNQAFIEHNGTGSFVNYSISPFIGNWTNYTLNLSDATNFNRKNITIRAIYSNDTFTVTNTTSPALSFNLDPGLAPSISGLWLDHLGTNTTNTNLYTNLTIYTNVSDDVGIFAVTANLTYPSNTSIVLNLTGNPDPINRTWNYTFETQNFPLNETGNYTVYWIKVNDTADNQTNTTYNMTFYVNNTLTVSTSVSPSTPGKGATFDVVISVYDVNNNLHEYPVNLTINCLNRSFQETNFTVPSINGTHTFENCYAHDSYSYPFDVTVNATDIYNNTGQKIHTLTTEATPSGGTSPGGGGGGGGAGGVVQNVTIINATLNATTNFNFTLSTSEIQIYRGEDASILGELSNTGNTNLTVYSSIFLNGTCCILNIAPSEFTLEVGGSEVPFTVSIHVNTTTQPETEYFADVKLKSGTLEKSKRIKIIVKENPTITSLRDVTGQITEVEEKIQEYAKLGISTGFLEDLLNKIKGATSDSASAIEQDDINRLKQYDNLIQSSLKQINDELNKLALLKTIYENKWSIITGLTIGLVTTYLVIQVIIPYSKIELEIRKLKLERDSLAKSRAETTKSFFLRKIDDRTFRSIITEGQGKIYKFKSMIDLKNEEKSKLLRTRLNPLSVGGWIKQKFSKKSIKDEKNKK